MNHYALSSRLGLLALTAVLTSCSSDASPAEIAGVPLHDVLVTRLTEPSVVIGNELYDEDDFIHPIVSGQDSSQSVYVFDVRLLELRKFSRDGVFQQQIARRGDGPGEISTPGLSIHVAENTVQIWQDRPGRLATVTDKGIALEDRTVGTPWLGHRGVSSERIVTATGAVHRVRREQTGPYGNSLLAWPAIRFDLVRLRSNSTAADTLHTYTSNAAHVRLAGGRAQVMIPNVAMGPLLAYDRHSDGWIRVDGEVPRTSESAFVVRRLSPEGDEVAKRTYTLPATRIPSHVTDTVAHRIRALGSTTGDSRFGAMSTSEIEDALQWPEHYQPVQHVSVAPDGTIWLLLPVASGATEWLVLDPELLPLGRVALPMELRYSVFTETRIWGTLLGDVPVVVAFERPTFR